MVRYNSLLEAASNEAKMMKIYITKSRLLVVTNVAMGRRLVGKKYEHCLEVGTLGYTVGATAANSEPVR
jgi:hypothetical protein